MCRNWRFAARPIIFSNVTFNSKERCNNIINNLKNNPSLSILVKSLDVYYMGELDLQLLETFSEFFPHLEEFTFQNTRLNYTNYCTVVCNDGFPFVKRIPEASYDDQEGEYLKILEKKRHLVTCLGLTSTKKLELLYDKLDMFTKLEALFFEFAGASSSRFMDCIESATQKSNLQTVTKLTITFRNIDKLSIPKNLDNIQPMHNVTKLLVVGFPGRFVIDDLFLLYIMKKFPNLTELIMAIKEVCGHGEGDEEELTLSTDVAVQFLHYVSTIKLFNIDYFLTREKTNAILEKLCSFNSKNKSLRYPHLKWPFNDYNYGGQGYNINTPVLSLDSTKLVENEYERTIGVNFGQLFDFSEPELDFIALAGHHFDKITLEEVHNSFLLFPLLNYLAANNDHLTSLKIINSPNIKLDEEIANYFVSHKTITKLESIECKETSNLLEYIPKFFPNIETLSITYPIQVCGKSKRDITMLESPDMSLNHLEISMKFFTYGDLPVTLIKGLCMELHTHKKAHYLLFSFSKGALDDIEDHMLYQLEFKKQLTISELKDIKDDKQYFMY